MAEKKKRKTKAINDRDRSKPQNTAEVKPKSKIVVLEEYFNFNSFRKVPITKETIMRLAESGVQWARENERAYKVKQFMAEQGLNQNTWWRWCQTHPELQEANDQMVMLLGNRRERGLIERKFDASSTMFMMPHYDSDWKKMSEWKASLTQKAEASGTGATINVVMSEIPRSPLVPDRKES